MVGSEQLKTEKILVVDDVASMRNLTNALLRDMGYRNICYAVDGDRALKEIKKQEFDLVMCDWNMPVMSGLELLQNLRADSDLCDMPFLMVTASAEVGKIKEAIAAGVSDYIVKPFKQEVLKEKLCKILGE